MRLSQRTETFGSEQVEVFASDRGHSSSMTATIDLANFTQATHAPNGYLPAGLHVSWDDVDTGVLKSDGNVADEYAAVLMSPYRWPKTSAGAYETTGIIHVAILNDCDLYEKRLEVAPSAAAKANALEAGVKYRQY